ncbi:hypothetical protein LTSEALA_5514 [Salmonella enterica subsp. enterica serovar Alachua str. R6-377]|uniref:Uncharacterized protein n=1 Tax=Salmonella enterica subsp. enterica serovar Alachua str. R6-377 TaxID=913241 RepID=G5LVZ8_SALET|nr:hypothetical protein LTSEALA_5514 [Salmonella enterica subsp. enterica serovar Alachua str. R6-377]
MGLSTKPIFFATLRAKPIFFATLICDLTRKKQEQCRE